MHVDCATEAKDIDISFTVFAQQFHTSVGQERVPLAMARVLCALGFHAVTKSFDGLIVVRGLDHVKVMEPHRDRVMIAHDITAGRAGIEHLPFIELLAVRAHAAVVVAWAL